MHINNNDLDNFQNNKMNTDEMIAFLKHLDDCDYCLEQFMDDPANALTPAPVYMKETILKRAAATDIHVQKTATTATHKIQLFYEGLRTVVGVVLALIMLFCLGQANLFSIQVPQSATKTAKAAEARRETQSSFRNFSDGITDGFTDSITDGSQKIVDYINSISKTITKGGN